MIAHYVELARTHAQSLVLTVPLCGAAIVLIVPSPRLVWVIVVTAALVAATLALDRSSLALFHGAAPIHVAPIGAVVQFDGVGLFAVPLIACLSALILLSSGALLRDFNDKAAPFALALTLCVGAGWTGALLARDFVGVFLATETAWLACAGLVALGAERDRGGLNGALRMLSVGGMGSALTLLGVGLVINSVGVTDLASLPLARVTTPGPASTGVGLILLGVALKAGLAPLHFWIGAAQGRGSPLAAMVVGGICTTGALAVMARVAAFAIPSPAIGSSVSVSLAVLGAVSIVVGSLQAVGASNLRRLVAYAGAAQAGNVLLGVSLGSPAGFAAALIQLVAMTAAALVLLGGVAAAGSTSTLSALDGLGRRAPFASIAITAGALSLMGAPLTIGFLGRWRVIEAALGAGWWWAAVAVISASLAGVFYGGRLIERLYFRRAASALAMGRDPWRLALAPTLAAAVLAIAIGWEPSILLRAADAAASLLAGGAP